jgi:hypothetical protein
LVARSWYNRSRELKACSWIGSASISAWRKNSSYRSRRGPDDDDDEVDMHLTYKLSYLFLWARNDSVYLKDREGRPTRTSRWTTAAIFVANFASWKRMDAMLLDLVMVYFLMHHTFEGCFTVEK